jgi:hypothetical protein
VFGAKTFGGRSEDRIEIMVAEDYKLSAYLSDLGGNDPSAHENDPAAVVRIVRDFLHETPSGEILPGAQALIGHFEVFKAQLPEKAQQIRHQPDEVSGFSNYRTYLWCVKAFVTELEV